MVNNMGYSSASDASNSITSADKKIKDADLQASRGDDGAARNNLLSAQSILQSCKDDPKAQELLALVEVKLRALDS